ncbi:hypothetical protein ILUMI_15666, partial [Ignelater luminosus]
MMQAVRSILDGGLSVKQVGIRFEIPRTPLSSYIKKCKNGGIDWQQVTIHEVLRMTPNYSVRQVFNENQEAMLADYFVCIADSQATSLARTMSFNRPVVGNFYGNIEQVLSKYSNVEAERIYNIDETEFTTVQGASKVIAPKGYQAQPGSSHHNQKESQPLHRHHDQKTQENEMDITSMAPQRIGEGKKKKIEKESSSDEDQDSIQLYDSDDGSTIEEEDVVQDLSNIRENSFVLVQFATKKSIRYFVGQVVEIHNDGLTVNFFRKQENHFAFPLVKDKNDVDLND